MPYKHQVTDRNGKIHKRVSAERQYHFATVTHIKAFTQSTGTEWPARTIVTWSRDERLARASARRYANAAYLAGFEIIPCTPIATGKHAASV